MTRKQLLVIILLGVADCVVLGGLIVAMVFTPRLTADRTAASSATPLVEQTGTPVLPPTWTPTHTPTRPPTVVRPPTQTLPPTRTPRPIPTRTPTPIPTPWPVQLNNADFDEIELDRVPGWEAEAVVTWSPGDDYNPETSRMQPIFKAADDPLRFISDSTLQIESPLPSYPRFEVTLYQTVAVQSGSWVRFEIKARGFAVDGAKILVRAGIDPHGRAACEGGLWGELQPIDQTDDVVTLRAPETVVGEEARVTVCFFALPDYAVPSKAAFFDDALLLALPPSD